MITASSIREENPAMRSAFENATRGRGFVSEWRDDEADAFGVGDRVLQYARAADIVIASQIDPDWPGAEAIGRRQHDLGTPHGFARWAMESVGNPL
jgi:hypothetical protein